MITILGQPFEVVFEPRRPMDRDSVGTAMHAEQKLVLKEGQGAHQERDTLLHELLHVCGLVVGHELEEHQVASITPVLLDALRQNPVVVAYLTEPMVSAGDVPVA